MAEADELCERIAIVDHGRILAIGTPAELKRRVQRESIFRLELDRLDGGVGALARLPGVVRRSAGRRRRRASAERQTVAINLVLEDDAALGGVVGALGGLGSHILGLRKSEPSLEDVFVELVGRGFEDEDEPDEHGRRPRRPRRDADRGPATGRTRGRRAGESALVDLSSRAPPPESGPREASAWSPPPGPRDEPARDRRPRLPARSRACSARSRGSPSRSCCRSSRPRRSSSSIARSRRPQEYVGFVVLGGAMTAFWLNVIWMMANQLCWEKSQGNLELYFAAPMNFMSILLRDGPRRDGHEHHAGRVVGPGHRDARLRRQLPVDQWAPAGGVFVLTLAALYGLGMVLASLFLVWGREAWHLTSCFTEPVYFVSGLNFPVGRLGLLGALSVAIIPLAVGLDAMRQLAFVGAAVPDRDAAAGGRGADPRRHDRRLPAGRALDARGRWSGMARREGRLSIRWQ